ncbi:tRNA (adenosine(37)-N6)-threonylcarbamoyltransferase complex ATPase subunit type 1 TsaE, partial [Candidatus Shapirobacteria bacterium]|nr:tRNA (adenosine(37)-N6)-threonylcarbamoyltransferase complex ATPase subunit type 1 TsaE [Candidatus Shapirobacteria bacterium]
MLGVPVTATSANLSGRTPNYTVNFVKKISQKKQDMIDLIVDAGKLHRNKPSTVVDATESEIKILRRGDLLIGKSQTLNSKSEKETEKIAEFLLKKISKSQIDKFDLKVTGQTSSKKQITNYKPIVFGLTGDLGCGKTVFSRKIGHLLGVKEKITSPTFVIYNEYKISPNPSLTRGEKNILKFLHFDLYRLAGKHEFEEIEFLNQFSEGTIACIEWPEIMGAENFEKLKEKVNYVAVEFKYVDEKTREIRF